MQASTCALGQNARKERRATWGRKQAKKERRGFRQVGMGAQQGQEKQGIADGENSIWKRHVAQVESKLAQAKAQAHPAQAMVINHQKRIT